MSIDFEPTTDSRHRHLVICLDGTSNQFSAKNSNVVKLFGVLDISNRQLAYYDSGVGTYLPVGASSSWTTARQSMAKMADLALAWNFDDHVKNAYTWLMNYYQPEDRIYLFGFSRGAYAARALVGMVERIGLLPAGNESQVALAYDVYKSPEFVTKQGNFVGETEDLATKYRGTFGISREVDFHFVGVWDTVSSLGGLDAPDLPFANTVSIVKHFRQALALDERRVKFQPEYRRPGNHTHCVGDVIEQTPQRSTGSHTHKEVWFLGVHSDVGGSRQGDAFPALANVSFRWMLWEATRQGLRLGPISMLRMPAIMRIPAVQAYVDKRLPEVRRWLNDDYLLPYKDNREILSQIRLNFGIEHRRRIVHLAAAHDMTPLGQVASDGNVQPFEDDRAQSRTESLQGVIYRTMEYVPLPCTFWHKKQNGESVEWFSVKKQRMHRGDGRYIREDQRLHRSVQLRLELDHTIRQRGVVPEEAQAAGYEPYPKIQAHLPDSWGFGENDPWAAVRTSERPALWEDTEPLPASFQ